MRHHTNAVSREASGSHLATHPCRRAHLARDGALAHTAEGRDASALRHAAGLRAGRSCLLAAAREGATIGGDNFHRHLALTSLRGHRDTVRSKLVSSILCGCKETGDKSERRESSTRGGQVKFALAIDNPETKNISKQLFFF